MKIIKRLPKLNESLHKELIDSGWKTLREPGSLVSAITLSIPLMIVNLFIAIVVIGTISTISFEKLLGNKAGERH